MALAQEVTETEVSKEEADRVARLLRREIQRAAARLIKVRRANALSFANKQIEKMQENGLEEDGVYWEKIAAEVERQLYPPEGVDA